MVKISLKRNYFLVCLLLTCTLLVLTDSVSKINNCSVMVQEPQTEVFSITGAPQFILEEIGQFDDGGFARGVFVSDDYAFVADDDGGFW